MKKYVWVVITGLSFLSACSEESRESSGSFDFNLTQDTVRVDSKEGIINLQYGLNSPELSKDGKYLYHYNHGQAKFDKINLEELSLEETLQFELEGPDGMGTYIGGYALTSKDQMMIWSYGLNAIFDQSGKKVRDLKLDKIAQEEIKGSEAFPIRLIEKYNDPNVMFGLYVKWEGTQYFLLKYDLERESYEKILLPETEKLKEFRMEIEHEGRPAGGFGPPPIPTVVNEKIIMSNSAYNEAYVYDMSLDSLYLISWDSNLTGNKNEAKLPKKVQLEEAEEYRKMFSESINFMPPQWDQVSERFIRLSCKTNFSEELNEYGEAKPLSSEVFLTVLDKDLNILKETKLEEYDKEPPAYFFMDNKIWLFENIDDELGFVRIGLE